MIPIAVTQVSKYLSYKMKSGVILQLPKTEIK